MSSNQTKVTKGAVKQFITRPEPHGFGIDVGWRLFDREGKALDVWWGNTRDEQTLALLIEDCRQHGYAFTLKEPE